MLLFQVTCNWSSLLDPHMRCCVCMVDIRAIREHSRKVREPTSCLRLFHHQTAVDCSCSTSRTLSANRGPPKRSRGSTTLSQQALRRPPVVPAVPASSLECSFGHLGIFARGTTRTPIVKAPIPTSGSDDALNIASNSLTSIASSSRSSVVRFSGKPPPSSLFVTAPLDPADQLLSER